MGCQSINIILGCCYAAALRDTIRQYYIKLEDDQPIAGLATAKTWVLRGPQNDTLGLHEFLAMNLSAGTGLWTPHTRYTEVRHLGCI